MKKGKLTTSIKKSLRKLKYLDKTQSSYFLVTSFLATFLMFTGFTYSYFTLSNKIGNATIAIARLKYNLSSTLSSFNEGNISVPSGSTLYIDLNLESLNTMETKYALQFSSDNPNIKVYYSADLANNMAGVIGPTGSKIKMCVVIVNKGTEDGVVNLTVHGGYLQNTLESNITEGHFDQDIIVRSIILDDDMQDGVINQDFPTKESGYSYFRTSCNDEVSTSWNSEAWNLEISDIGSRVACDVYFKKMTSDIEVYFALKKKDGSLSYENSLPTDGTYTFKNAECNTGAIASWDEVNKKLNISGMEAKTACIGYFQEN